METRLKATTKIGMMLAIFQVSSIVVGSATQNATTSVNQGGIFEEISQKLRKVKPPLDAIELEMIRFFPATRAPEEQSLWHPQDMAFDPVGNLYVIDYRGGYVNKYDSSGHFAKRFGQKGQGPGDLSLPYSIKIRKETIAIVESGNRRLQFFDLEGNSRKSVVLRSFCFSRDIGEDGIIYGTFSRFENQNDLIEVLSSNGEFLRSFGTPIEHQYTWAMAYLNSSFLFIDSKGDIAVIFQYLPYLRLYTPKGNLIGEYRLETEIFRIKEEFNRESPSRMLKGGPAAFSPIVKGAQLFDDHLFVLDTVSTRLWIREIDMSGKIRNTYWAPIEDDFSSNNMLIRKEDGRIVFFILQFSPEARICVFAPKNTQK